MNPHFAAPTSSRFSLDRVQPLSGQQTTSAKPRETMQTFSIAAQQRQRPTGSSPVAKPTAETRLFNALADVKVWTSQVAMHLPRVVRDRLFGQLDVLHDPAEWDEDDRHIVLASFQTMIRAMLYHRMNSRPALSIMPSGNVLALWSRGSDRLTVEFLPGSRVRWIVSVASQDKPERAAGESPIERLAMVLAPYGADRWLDGG